MSEQFKILAIDGGGFRGVYSACLLMRIEEEFRVDWLKTFGLMAGTSTGSIIAAGIACGLSAKSIFNLYKENGENIFKKRLFLRSGLFASKYRNSALKKVLSTYFGERKFGEIQKPLILPATDIGNGCVHVFKSRYDDGFVRDREVLIRDAVLASCSAPTYFDPCVTGKYLLADGGLWANCPALVAVIDAKRRLGQNLDDIKILSIGTGNAKAFYPQKRDFWKRIGGWGFAGQWRGGKFIEMLLNLQSSTVNNMLGLLLKPEQILRLNFESDLALSIDDPREFNDLVSRADRDFTHNAEKINKFLR